MTPIKRTTIAEIFASDIPIREKIFQLESFLLQLPQADMPLIHRFADGLYSREIFIPRGTLLTGRIHKVEHFCIINKGDVSVLTEDGVKRFVAPSVFVSRAGIKRVIYAHEDTTWMTIHACKETDVEKIENLLTTNSYEEFEQLSSINQQNLGESVCHSQSAAR